MSELVAGMVVAAVVQVVRVVVRCHIGIVGDKL